MKTTVGGGVGSVEHRSLEGFRHLALAHEHCDLLKSCANRLSVISWEEMTILAARTDKLAEVFSEGGPLGAPGLPTCRRDWISAHVSGVSEQNFSLKWRDWNHSLLWVVFYIRIYIKVIIIIVESWSFSCSLK